MKALTPLHRDHEAWRRNACVSRSSGRYIDVLSNAAASLQRRRRWTAGTNNRPLQAGRQTITFHGIFLRFLKRLERSHRLKGESPASPSVTRPSGRHVPDPWLCVPRLLEVCRCRVRSFEVESNRDRRTYCDAGHRSCASKLLILCNLTYFGESVGSAQICRVRVSAAL